jgi:hypothetical protein
VILTVAFVDKDRNESFPVMAITRAQDPAVFPFTLKPADVLETAHVFDLVEILMARPSVVVPFFAVIANDFPVFRLAAITGSAGDDKAFEVATFGELFETDDELLGACVTGVSAFPPGATGEGVDDGFATAMHSD